MSKVNDFLTEAGVFYLATVDGDQPKVRPLGAHLEMDGKVLFGVGERIRSTQRRISRLCQS